MPPDYFTLPSDREAVLRDGDFLLQASEEWPKQGREESIP